MFDTVVVGADDSATAGKAVAFSALTVLASLAAILIVPSPAFRSMAFGIMLSVVAVLAATLLLRYLLLRLIRGSTAGPKSSAAIFAETVSFPSILWPKVFRGISARAPASSSACACGTPCWRGSSECGLRATAFSP